MKDIIIIGAGHAGVEAALAAAKLNKDTMLITGDLSKVASLPCNPSIGGPAKGIVVREIDALGGMMGKAADLGCIQIKMLNASKGPAVWALRAQIDKELYPQIVLKFLKSQPNLTLKEALVDQLLIEDNQVKGVILQDQSVIQAKKVIITTGTYLSSVILMGSQKTKSGPNNEPTTSGISQQLKTLGFKLQRLKTGTPPRILKSSIDYQQTTLQPGDTIDHYFSFDQKDPLKRPSIPCYLTHTNLKTHQIITANLHRSSMYSGLVEGIGPRYCPSIEDKIVRFDDKDRHQVFLEPESLSSDEIYVQGISTSMPKDVQEEIIHSIKGLEKAIIKKYAYAIEYDAIDPLSLKPSLETKLIKNLYTAGQINGTSGYEEAAGQGLIAGINAALALDDTPPIILQRNQAYIGVLIDDLVTKGTQEPYRLLTSRAEHRLLLRHDNADLRLREIGYQIGLIDQATYRAFKQKEALIETLINQTKELRINPTPTNLAYLQSINSSPIYEGISLYHLLKRPEINHQTIKHLIEDHQYSDEVITQVEIRVKYEGYIQKAQREAEKLNRLEQKQIPQSINYQLIHNLSKEAKEKLTLVRPLTLGQATRIPGVNPADISMLLIYLEANHA